MASRRNFMILQQKFQIATDFLVKQQVYSIKIMAKAKNNIDKENMKEVISKSPQQLTRGLDLAKNIKIEGEFKNVIICGMGGSALPANILNTVTSPRVPIYIHRDYGLPKTANEDSLIICISYSGNTEETVSALEESITKNITAVSIATGGKIEKYPKIII